MLAIYKRELRSLFCSMTAYVFIAIYMLIFGFYFRYYNLSRGATTIGYPIFVCFWVYMLFSLLTMKSLPEEKKEKIDQLLYTSPVSVAKIVTGKYFAMCTVWLFTVAILGTCPLIIKHFGYSLLTTDYALLFAYFLLGCALIAICMFISSLTESQLIAAIVSLVAVFAIAFARMISNYFSTDAYVSLVAFVAFAALFGLISAILSKNSFFGFIIGFLLALAALITYLVKRSLFEGALQKLLKKIALSDYLESIVANYMFDLKVVILYVSIIVLFLFFTVQTIQKRRYS